MVSVTIPLWLIVAAAAVAAFLSILMIWRRLRRQKPVPEIQTRPMTMDTRWPEFSGQIRQLALAQQIDAVFNALTAVLESERIKLKALAKHACDGWPAVHQTPGVTASPAVVEEDANAGGIDIGRSILACAQQGLKPDDIARRLGLSGAEVALAMKVHREPTGRKLEAVA